MFQLDPINCNSNSEFSSILENRYEHDTILGAFKPNVPWTIFINEQHCSTPEIRREIYLHELTHLQLFTSTAVGHVQQLLSSIISSFSGKEKVLSFASSPLQRCLAVLHEASWEIHEGAATITPYLRDHPFTHSFTNHHTFALLPNRYKHAASSFSMAVGALLPMNLANFGYVAANAVAQFCLNTNVLCSTADYWSALLDSKFRHPEIIFYDHISRSENHPQCRLLRLIEVLYSDASDEIPNRIAHDFFSRISLLSFVTSTKNEIHIASQTNEDTLLIQDALNLTILDELDRILPEYIKYKRVLDMEHDFLRLLGIFGIQKQNWDSMADNLHRRAQFTPKIEDII